MARCDLVGGQVRNGPPLAVRMTRLTSCSRPHCIAWKIGGVFGIDRQDRHAAPLRLAESAATRRRRAIPCSPAPASCPPRTAARTAGRPAAPTTAASDHVDVVALHDLDQAVRARDRPVAPSAAMRSADGRRRAHRTSARRRRGGSGVTCSSKLFAAAWALRAATRKDRAERSITSSALHPMEPVDPRMAMR